MEAFPAPNRVPDLPDTDTNLELDPLAAARATPIEVLVAKGPASVRLTNAISAGSVEGRIPCLTVGDYLDAGPAASALFMRALRNFGRLTAVELDALVARYLEDSQRMLESGDAAARSQCAIDAERKARLDTLVAQLDGLTYVAALKGQVPSVRLANALAAPDLGTRPVTELLTGGVALRAELLRRPNFGRTSLRELEALCQAAVIRVLAEDCADPEALVADCGLLFDIPCQGEAGRALAQQILETLQAQPPRDCGLDELLDWAMPELPERELAVITRRYGLNGASIETLEEISANYAVTRERIRQLEAKALRRLRAKLDTPLLLRLVDEASGRFWIERSVPFLAIDSRDSYQLRRELSPELALALDILDLSVTAWLERTSAVLSNGYLSRSVEADAVRALGARLMDRLKDQPLPIAVRELLGESDPKLVEAAVCLQTPFVLFESYLLHDRPRVRLKRAVRLHALLSATKRALTLYQLGDLYVARFPADRCALRDLVIVMEISPQLFLEIEDGLWTALGNGGAQVEAADAEFEAEAPSDVDQATIAGSLQQALRTRGPSLVGDLYRDGANILPAGRSRSSIAPVLVGRPDIFRRILPGVYALPEQLPSPDELLTAPLPYWLTEAQGRTFAFARLAGEAWGTFLLWNPTAEYRLCAWARFAAEPALFHSLLSVAEIDSWPIDDVQKDDWRRLAEQRGRFELAVSGKVPIHEIRPGLDRLLAACRIATERGSINWLQINRIMGRRLDAAGGQGLLALMIALELVTPPAGLADDARLRPHQVTPRAAMIAESIAQELIRHGEIEWNSPLGQTLAEEAVSADPTLLGWASRDRIAELLDTEPSTNFEAEFDDEDEDDLIARLMREHRQSVELDRRSKAAQWLLEV